jgi:hypothetical protein
MGFEGKGRGRGKHSYQRKRGAWGKEGVLAFHSRVIIYSAIALMK